MQNSLLYSLYSSYIINNSYTFNITLYYSLSTLSTSSNNNESENHFNEWLAGIIDGDGHFHILLSKYPTLTIDMEMKNLSLLTYIASQVGGLIYTNIKDRPNVARITIRDRSLMIALINRINGNIRNSIRIVQFKKVCDILNIVYLSPVSLTSHNAWTTGYFDSDGTIIASFNKPCSMRIHITNRYAEDLQFLDILFGGKTYAIRDSKGDTYAHRWTVTRKSDILNMSTYFKVFPPRSHKLSRVTMIDTYYSLMNMKYHKVTSPSYSQWLLLADRWKTEF